MRNIYIYKKNNEKIETFEQIVSQLRLNKEYEFMYILNESGLSNNTLMQNIDDIKKNDVLIVSSVSVLGKDSSEIKFAIKKIIEDGIMLVLLNNDATFKYGVSQPMNKAILEGILNMISTNSQTNQSSKVGRNKIDFPENWEYLYEKWTRKEISSNEFIEKSGLKRATFYNMLAAYKLELKNQNDFLSDVCAS